MLAYNRDQGPYQGLSWLRASSEFLQKRDITGNISSWKPPSVFLASTSSVWPPWDRGGTAHLTSHLPTVLIPQMYQDEGTASTRNAKYVLGGVESSERAHAAAQLPVHDLTDLTVLPDLIHCDQMNSKLTPLHRHQTSYNQTIAHPPPFCFQFPPSPLLRQLHSDQLP